MHKLSFLPKSPLSLFHRNKPKLLSNLSLWGNSSKAHSVLKKARSSLNQIIFQQNQPKPFALSSHMDCLRFPEVHCPGRWGTPLQQKHPHTAAEISPTAVILSRAHHILSQMISPLRVIKILSSILHIVWQADKSTSCSLNKFHYGLILGLIGFDNFPEMLQVNL